MVSEKFVRLINQEIDGKNSPRQSRKLKKYLVENSEAREMYDGLRDLSSSLYKISDVEPPAYLEKNILNSIPFQIPRKRMPGPAIFGKVSDFLFGKRVRFVYAFSSGMIVGVFLIFLISQTILNNHSSVDISDLYGTMVVNYPSGDFTLSEQLQINANDVKGDLQISSNSEAVLIEICLNSEVEAGITLESAQNEYYFKGFRNSGALNSTLSVDSKSIEFFHSGENRYLIILGRKGLNLPPIRIKILSRGDLIYDRDIHPVKSETK